MRLVRDKTEADLAAEWDNLAQTRFDQIMSGADITFSLVLSPLVTSFVSDIKPRSILDAGCGTGILTSSLSTICPNIIGIDPSVKSIEIARKNFRGVKFIPFSLQNFEKITEDRFELIVANMVVMDVADLAGFVEAASSLLVDNGNLLVTLTHPWFWPEYYGYGHLDWFEYNKEQAIEAPFRISSSFINNKNSTHIHRPLESYFKAFNAHLNVIRFEEIMPGRDIQKRYPELWRFPRYCMFLIAKRSTRELVGSLDGTVIPTSAILRKRRGLSPDTEPTPARSSGADRR